MYPSRVGVHPALLRARDAVRQNQLAAERQNLQAAERRSQLAAEQHNLLAAENVAPYGYAQFGGGITHGGSPVSANYGYQPLGGGGYQPLDGDGYRPLGHGDGYRPLGGDGYQHLGHGDGYRPLVEHVGNAHAALAQLAHALAIRGLA